MSIPRNRLRWWIIGTAVAFAGVACVRLLGEQLPDHTLILTLLGYTLVITGLFLITLGTRRTG